MIGSKQKRKWEIDPVESEIVRRMFNLAAVGDGGTGPLGVKSIAGHVNAAGLRTCANNYFGTGTVHEILTREAYTGSRFWKL